jgi:hypothetical protein
MKQSPSREADRSLDIQEIGSTLWKAKVHYRVVIETCPYPEPDESSPLLSIPLPMYTKVCQVVLPFTFPHQNPVFTVWI